MNDTYIVTTYVVIDDILKAWKFEHDCRATGHAAESLTVTVLAAKYFQNHHERVLCLMMALGYVRSVSVSRFNWRLHKLHDWFFGMVTLAGEVFGQGETFIIDSLPLPVCKRVRAWRCKKVRGREYYGYYAAKDEKFFGWRLHLVCTTEGIPVSFELLPAAYDVLTPVHELTARLPKGGTVFGDKGYIIDLDSPSIFVTTAGRLVSLRRKNMTPNSWADDYNLAQYRQWIETFNSQLKATGIHHLHACTTDGFDLKAWASLLALAFTNIIADWQLR